MISNDGRPGGGRDEGGDGAPPFRVRDDFHTLQAQAERILRQQPSPALVRATGRRICRAITLLADDIAQQLAEHVIDTHAQTERR